MDETLLKRIQSLSPEKRKTLEQYLNNKGIKDISILLNENPDTEDNPVSLLEQVGEGIPEIKELKINPMRSITSYLYRAFTLSIVLAEQRMYSWYYQHFVQLCAQTDSHGYTLVDFMEPGFSEELFEKAGVGYRMLKDVNIIKYSIEKINAGCYLNICLDEYYLNDKAAFKKWHFVHESLIYGYDNINRKFSAVSFNAFRIFDKIVFDYDMFAKAFEKGKVYYKKHAPYAENDAIILLFPKFSDESYTHQPAFKLDIFLKDLNNYLHSVGDVNKILLLATENTDVETKYGSEIKYGLEVYDVIISKLENMLKGKMFIDYRALHLLSEHKKIMHERLQYIISGFTVSDEIKELSCQYLGIVKQFEDIRRKFLEQRYAETGFHVWEKSLTKQIISFLETVKEEERSILTRIYESLKSNCSAERGSVFR